MLFGPTAAMIKYMRVSEFYIRLFIWIDYLVNRAKPQRALMLSGVLISWRESRCQVTQEQQAAEKEPPIVQERQKGDLAASAA